MKTKILLLTFVVLIGIPSARSQGTLTWGFDRTNYTVTPTDSIFVTATVSNSSDQPYAIQGVSASFTGDLQSLYNFTFSLAPLYDATLAGHGTLQFEFGTLTPIEGEVMPGVYPADRATLTFSGLSEQFSENTFFVTVVAVPEPSTMCLCGIGLAVLLRVWNRKKVR